MRRDGELPDLLTVEEAAALLRVGRTKAYAMAREWRATEGRSGLPVLDFGNVLRVPLHRLELMVGGALRAPSPPADAPTVVDERSAPEHHEVGNGPTPARPRRSARRRPKIDASQLTLLHADDVTDVSDLTASNSSSTRATEAE